MRVLFDAFWWHQGPIANRAVMREIITAWARNFPGDNLILVLPKGHSTRTDLPPLVEALESNLYPHALVNGFALSRLAKRRSADVVITHNFAPISGHSLVFIHDLMFEDHPEWFTRKENLYFRLMGYLARFADVVATSSHTEAARIRRLHPRLKVVEAVGLAPSSALLTANPIRPHELPAVQSFILCVGRLNERKNLGTTIQAAAGTPNITRDRPLVIVGSSEHSGVTANIPAEASELVGAGRIIFLGKVSDSHLRWLYEHADALVFMSKDEGFGLPAAEAQMFATPLIASNIAVMRENASLETTLVDVDDTASLTRALEAVRPRNKSSLTPMPVETLVSKWDDVVCNLRDLVMRPTKRL